jgi:flagellar biosynthesis GTPase FlhF
MILFGNGLQRKYKTKAESNIKSDAEVSQEKNDREALRKHHASKRAEREARLEHRDKNRKSITEDSKEQIKLNKKDEVNRLKQLESNRDNKIERQIKEAKEKTGHLARKHGLAEPNNPEALKHDRLHCYKCDMHLHIPNAYKELPEDVQALFGNDSDVRHFCCFCFGKMGDGEIIKLQDADSNKKIRMMIYNPEDYVRENADEIHQEDIDQIKTLTKERIAYYKAKIKKYEHVISLIGTVKHDHLQEVDDLVETVRNHAPTRYNYANN